MIKDFGVTQRESEISVYAGMVTSAFAFAEFSSGVAWGRLSDRIGRKPVLLTGLAGTALSMLIFGFAPNLPVALLARALGGLLNGYVDARTSCTLLHQKFSWTLSSNRSLFLETLAFYKPPSRKWSPSRNTNVSKIRAITFPPHFEPLADESESSRLYDYAIRVVSRVSLKIFISSRDHSIANFFFLKIDSRTNSRRRTCQTSLELSRALPRRIHLGSIPLPAAQPCVYGNRNMRSRDWDLVSRGDTRGEEAPT